MEGKRIFGIGFMYVVEISNIIQKTRHSRTQFDVSVFKLDEYPNLQKIRVSLMEEINSTIKDKYKEKVIGIVVLSIWEFKDEIDYNSFTGQVESVEKPKTTSSILMDEK